MIRNFFDNITTATTMRPPPQSKYRTPYNNQNKGYSCANERLSSYPINCSSGSLSMNETKSSYDESMDRTASTEFSEFDMKNEKNTKDAGNDNNEPEPEWFSCPASRHDVIDLRGFEDDEGHRGPSSDEIDRSNGKHYNTQGNLNQHRQHHNNQKQQKNFNYNGGKMNYQQQQQRYRHPLHQSSE
jgi:hypothetical protein